MFLEWRYPFHGFFKGCVVPSVSVNYMTCICTRPRYLCNETHSTAMPPSCLLQSINDYNRLLSLAVFQFLGRTRSNILFQNRRPTQLIRCWVLGVGVILVLVLYSTGERIYPRSTRFWLAPSKSHLSIFDHHLYFSIGR